MDMLWRKKELSIFCLLESFVDKINFNSRTFYKINGFVTTEFATLRFF